MYYVSVMYACCVQGYFHANRDRGLPFGPPPPPPFGMYPPVPRVRGHGSFHYDGPRGFGPPRPNVYVRHGGMRGYGGRHMDGPRPRYYRDQSHVFGPPPPVHNSFDPRRAGPMMSRESPSMGDLVHQASSADGILLRILCSFCLSNAMQYIALHV